MLDVIQRIVDEELQFRDDAELLANAGAKFVANLLLVGIDVLHNLFRLLTREYAEINAADTQVGTYAANADAHQHASHLACLPLEDVAQFLLYEAGYLVLSGCFHLINLQFDDLQFTNYSP